MPLHSSLGDGARLGLEKKKKMIFLKNASCHKYTREAIIIAMITFAVKDRKMLETNLVKQ